MTSTIDATHWLLDLVTTAARDGYVGGAVSVEEAHPTYLTRRDADPQVPLAVIVPDEVHTAAVALAERKEMLLTSGHRVRFAAPPYGAGFSLMPPRTDKHLLFRVVVGDNGLYEVRSNATIVVPPMLPAEADLFLAGGISNCPDWQAEAAASLSDLPIVVHNPRRPGELADDQAIAQIEWEHQALRRSKTILFWFPEETLCPITLFELGVWSAKGATIIVGTHPRYARRLDVVTQLRLSRPDVTVHDSLDDVLAEFRSMVAHRAIAERRGVA